MGEVGRTWSDVQADGFFAGWVDASPERIAAVEAERGGGPGGDLGAVVAESVGYWERKMAARAGRAWARERDRVEERARLFAESALAHGPNERARMVSPAGPGTVVVVLPEARFVLLSDVEYEQTRRWWLRLENPSVARGLANRIRREVREGERERRRAVRAAAVWRLQERAFERAQWREVIANRDSRPSRKRANQWAAIEEDRALAIALTVLAKTTPPQARK